MIKSLYIHIPFCKTICTYCSFKKRIYDENLAHQYIVSLINDFSRIPKKSLKTIYIGGGTPCSLSNNDLELLLSNLVGLLDGNYEFTIESNPENLLDIEKISILKKYKVNRVSIGVQTFNEKLLKILGRKHNEDVVYHAIENLLNNKITNINLDLIYGIPSQTLNDFIQDVKKVLDYNIKHISLYSLTIDNHTILFNKKYNEADEDLLRDMSDIATEMLKTKNFKRYEVSNYSLDNYESIHNLTYWYDEEYYGLGIGASGYENNIRYTNITTLHDFIKGIRKYDETLVDEYNHEYEYIMLNLRQNKGINLENYRKIFKKEFTEFYQEEIKQLKNLIEVNDTNVFVKEEHYMILNTIILKFINRLEVSENGQSDIKK